jgi:FkbM family methyltransferase
MALRRIRLDRERLRRVETALFDDAQPPLAEKRARYRILAEHLRTAASGLVPPLAVASHSQHGEDLILWDFFGRKLRGFFVDIGAHDGVSLSNTFFFESLGWSGICVEANPELARRCAAARPGSRVVHAACGNRAATSTAPLMVATGPEWASTRSFVSTSAENRAQLEQAGIDLVPVEVPCTTMDALLGPEVPTIDFVSIDVEGAELQVLQGFDFTRARPAVLVVEDNSRGTKREVADFLEAAGYRRALTIGVNDFYVTLQERRHFLV